MNWFSVNCITRDDFPDVVDRGISIESYIINLAGSPTEREPRTAIFLFLRMSPGMSMGQGGGWGKGRKKGRKRTGFIPLSLGTGRNNNPGPSRPVKHE